MGKKDPRIDAYIAKAAPFARPILSHLRKLIHRACPEVEETLKWGFPHFTYRGVLCGMAAFKQHCAFGFWHKQMREVVPEFGSGQTMGPYRKLDRRDQLPSDAVLIGLVKQAAALNESGVKSPRAKPKPKSPVKVPADLAAALAKNKKAQARFDDMSPSARREYVDWLTEAKRPETRATRLATAVEWISQGKSRNWKYER